MDLGLRDRVYVCTGASKGIGLAAARALLSDGARVVLSSRDERSLACAVSELRSGDAVVPLCADMAAHDTGERLARCALETFGRLDGALISVGGPPFGSTAEISDDMWRSSFETVFLGSLRVVRAVTSASTSDSTAVALVLSTSVKQPLANLAISNGLRPGLAMLAKTLADELGPQGVRVIGLVPGSIETDRLRDAMDSADDPESARRAGAAAIPLRRFGSPDEVGRVVAFALSPVASYITGSLINVDGGASRTL